MFPEAGLTPTRPISFRCLICGIRMNVIGPTLPPDRIVLAIYFTPLLAQYLRKPGGRFANDFGLGGDRFLPLDFLVDFLFLAIRITCR